jgi:hypothetical protein
MAQEDIKKVIIKNEELPPLQFSTVYSTVRERDEIDTLHYDFRYRIVSEDKNRYSHWSPITRFIMPNIEDPPFPYTATNRFSISKSGNPEVINAIWSKPGSTEEQTEYEARINKISTYDVWIRWNNNNTTNLNDAGWTEWEYVSTTSSNNFSILKKDNDVKRIEIAIQASTTRKVRDYFNNKLTLFRGLSGTI